MDIVSDDETFIVVCTSDGKVIHYDIKETINEPPSINMHTS